MATTPNYQLPLFETNSIPSWLRDWNSAMTKIDTSINNVAQSVSGASTDASNAIATANAAAATANNLSTTVTSLSDRVTALEGGSGGGTTPTPAFNPSDYQITVHNSAIWRDNGDWTQIPMNIATQNISLLSFNDMYNEQSYSNRLLFSITAGQGLFAVVQHPEQGGRVVLHSANYNAGSYPVTINEISASISINFGSVRISNAYTISHEYTSASAVSHNLKAGFNPYQQASMKAQYLDGGGQNTYTLQKKAGV